ncbi:MAG: hypothetical protein LBB20_01830 [Puniceicoccales bacterium]|jgi:hypothetical protein|nr:hypothetical protein [Puniceicoccales bacterium]
MGKIIRSLAFILILTPCLQKYGFIACLAGNIKANVTVDSNGKKSNVSIRKKRILGWDKKKRNKKIIKIVSGESSKAITYKVDKQRPGGNQESAKKDDAKDGKIKVKGQNPHSNIKLANNQKDAKPGDQKSAPAGESTASKAPADTLNLSKDQIKTIAAKVDEILLDGAKSTLNPDALGPINYKRKFADNSSLTITVGYDKIAKEGLAYSSVEITPDTGQSTKFTLLHLATLLSDTSGKKLLNVIKDCPTFDISVACTFTFKGQKYTDIQPLDFAIHNNNTAIIGETVAIAKKQDKLNDVLLIDKLQFGDLTITNGTILHKAIASKLEKISLCIIEACKNDKEMLKTLFLTKAEIEVKGDNHYKIADTTPLFLAVYYKYENIVNALLKVAQAHNLSVFGEKCGFEANDTKINGCTPFFFALCYQSDADILLKAAQANNISIDILAEKCDLLETNTVKLTNITPFHSAAVFPNIRSAIEKLLKSDKISENIEAALLAKADLETKGNTHIAITNGTVLHFVAAYKNNLDYIDLILSTSKDSKTDLLNAKCDEFKSQDGQKQQNITAADIASFFKNEAYKQLLNAQAN